MQERGILYVATGQSFNNEAVCSMRSVRRHGCDLPILLRTTEPEHAEPLVPPGTTIERIEPVTGLWCKPLHVPPPAFRQTLFLDTDTVVVHEDAFLPFEVLNRYPFAMAHAPKRGFSNLRRIVNCVSTFNSGVVFFDREHPKTEPVFQHWRKAYRPHRHRHRVSDQAILSACLWQHEVPVFVLPPEWNCRGRISGIPHAGMLRILHHRKASGLQMGGKLRPELFCTGEEGRF